MSRTARIAVAALAVAVVAGCAAEVEDDPVVEGATAAVEAYVAAIEAGDLEAATAMSAPEALEIPEIDDPTDVTAALAEVVEPMRDAWIVYEGTDFTWVDEASSESTDVVWFTVSYAVGEGTGSDAVEVMLVGDDAADPDAWRVTNGLLRTGVTYATDEVGPTMLGSVELEQSSGVAHPWGYPGVYLHEAVTVADGAVVEPMEVALGVELGPTWDDSLRQLDVTRP